MSAFPMRILSAEKQILRMKVRTEMKKWKPRAGDLRMKIVPTVRTSALCVENVCMRTDVKDTSYQALNLANQIRLLGDAP